jgi:UDP:flavonoid glycosyltransferase YjiC (YdhE family)
VRILFVCSPGLGHLNPLLSLANAARDRGHGVSFATDAGTASQTAALGFPTDIVGVDHGAELREALRTEKPPRENIREFVFTRFFAGKALEPRLRDIEAKCLPRRPDIIVHEIAEFAAPIAAALARTPLITVGFGPLLRPEVAEAAGGAAAPSWQSRGLAPALWGGLYRDLYVDPCPPALQIVEIRDLPAVLRMGRDTAKSEARPEWLGEIRAPLIYVTFGTISNRDHGLFRMVLDALSALPVEIVVTVGENNDPNDFGPQPRTTRIFQFVRQESLLPYCSAVVAHAGAGTLFGALALGIPLLLLPQSADQFYNAHQAKKAGAALSLMPEEASVEAIATSVERLLRDPVFATRARFVAAEMAAMPKPGDVLAHIAQLRWRQLK